MIAVPPSFVFHRISLNTSSPITGTNRKCLHSVSFSISVPKLPSTPRSADIFQPMNVLLYQPPGAYSSLSSLLTIFYHDTCVVFICQDGIHVRSTFIFLNSHISGHHAHAVRACLDAGIRVHLIDSADRIDRNLHRCTHLLKEIKSPARPSFLAVRRIDMT